MGRRYCIPGVKWEKSHIYIALVLVSHASLPSSAICGAVMPSTATVHQDCISTEPLCYRLTFGSLLRSSVDGVCSATHSRFIMTETMAVQHQNPLKRTSSAAEFNTPPTKKLHRGPIRHRKSFWDPQRTQRQEVIWQDSESQQSMLTRSIGLALQAVGFEAATPQAIDAFRGDVEECMRSRSAALSA